MAADTVRRTKTTTERHTGPVGDSLSGYPFLEVIDAGSARELKVKLSSIRLPYQIVSIYFATGRHHAWLSLTKPIK